MAAERGEWGGGGGGGGGGWQWRDGWVVEREGGENIEVSG